MWTCPKCPYAVSQTVLGHREAMRQMYAHIKSEHPQHWEHIQFVEAMSRD